MNRGIRNRRELIAAAALIAAVTGCDSAESAAPTPTPAAADFSQFVTTVLPFTLDNDAMGVAVNGNGVYVADFGEGNVAEDGGTVSGFDTGRILLLENGATTSRVVLSNAGAPTGLALAADGSIYFPDLDTSGIRELPNGSTSATALPFGVDLFDPDFVVTRAGDVVVNSSMDGVLKLASDAQSPESVPIFPEDLVGIDSDDAVYFTEMSGTVRVLEAGTTESREYLTPADGNVTAIAFDTNGDRYTIVETQHDEIVADGVTRTAYTYGLSLYPNGSDAATNLDVDLTEPHALAVYDGDVYISDGGQVFKLARG